jgi:hypothetical protein
MNDPKLPPGTKYCLCAGCDEYFTSEYTFDMHRAGEPSARYCIPPEKVLDKQRRPKLRLNDRGYWTSNRRKAEHWKSKPLKT